MMQRFIVLAAIAALAVAQTDAPASCGDRSDESCHVASTQFSNCVFLNGACKVDPCQSITDAAKCLAATADLKCIPIPFSASVSCMNAELVCDVLPYGACSQMSVCAKKSGSYCGIISKTTQGSSSVDCDLKFPTWSIALLMIWVCIMLILAFIIFLMMFGKKQVKNVEHSEVVVDSVQIRDNFSMSGTTPLMEDKGEI
jgi:amino acid transporter